MPLLIGRVTFANRTINLLASACVLVLSGCDTPEDEIPLVGLAAYGLALEEFGLSFTKGNLSGGRKFNYYEMDLGRDRLEVYLGAEKDQVSSIVISLTPNDPNEIHVPGDDSESEEETPIELCETIAQRLMPAIYEVRFRAYEKEEREGKSEETTLYHFLHPPPEGELKYRLNQLEIGSSATLSNGWRVTVHGQEALADENRNRNTYYTIRLVRI